MKVNNCDYNFDFPAKFTRIFLSQVFNKFSDDSAPDLKDKKLYLPYELFMLHSFFEHR